MNFIIFQHISIFIKNFLPSNFPIIFIIISSPSHYPFLFSSLCLHFLVFQYFSLPFKVGSFNNKKLNWCRRIRSYHRSRPSHSRRCEASVAQSLGVWGHCCSSQSACGSTSLHAWAIFRATTTSQCSPAASTLHRLSSRETITSWRLRSATSRTAACTVTKPSSRTSMPISYTTMALPTSRSPSDSATRNISRRTSMGWCLMTALWCLITSSTMQSTSIACFRRCHWSSLLPLRPILSILPSSRLRSSNCCSPICSAITTASSTSPPKWSIPMEQCNSSSTGLTPRKSMLPQTP